jgi:hypothetical protein|tara:strand:- start:1416 stop:2078 length:663 start_codon:yes stop_codon:yes gene_type:complete
MSSGFFSFMRGGVNRVIEQRKAAELAAYETAKEERAEDRALAREERGNAFQKGLITAANTVANQKDRRQSILEQAKTFFNMTFPTERITQKGLLERPEKTIVQATLKRGLALQSIQDLLESARSEPAILQGVETTLNAYITALTKTISEGNRDASANASAEGERLGQEPYSMGGGFGPARAETLRGTPGVAGTTVVGQGYLRGGNQEIPLVSAPSYIRNP